LLQLRKESSLQPISPEELVELGLSLDKYKNTPVEALKLLKVLDNKTITALLLRDTKIGKRLTAVNENPENSSAPELHSQIAGMKEHLKKKWSFIYQ